MSPEVLLQFEMFDGELVDNRTRKQKRLDRQRELPRQFEMFSQSEIAQFGVRANPKMPLSPKTRLELVMEDPRTEEERAQDLQREVEEHTYPMLPEGDGPDQRGD